MNVQNNGHGSTGWFLRLAIGALVLLSMLACSGPQQGPPATPDQASNLEIRTESSDLFEAVWRGQEARVRALADAGADVNQIDSKGDPVLLEAVWRGHVDIVRILVESGADVDAPDSKGDPVLLEAVWRGQIEMAGPNRDRESWSPPERTSMLRTQAGIRLFWRRFGGDISRW